MVVNGILLGQNTSNNIEISEQNFQSFITAGSYSYTISKTEWYYILMSGGGGGGNSFLASGGNGGNATSKYIRDETTDGKNGKLGSGGGGGGQANGPLSYGQTTAECHGGNGGNGGDGFIIIVSL